jgi:hypothetical protein
MLVHAAIRRDRRRALALGGACAIWGAMFIVNYISFLRPLANDGSLRAHWSDGFMPMSPEAFAWLARACAGLFGGYETMWLDAGTLVPWLRVSWLAAGVSVGGWIWLWTRARHRVATAVLATPLLLTLAASAVHAYAFNGRLVHFLVPVMLISFAAGIQALWRMTEARARYLALSLVLVVLAPTILRGGLWTIRPPGREEIKPVLAWISERIGPDDRIYVYHAADAPYLYYRDHFDLDDHPFIHGTRSDADANFIETDVRRLNAPGRVWVIFSHVWNGEDHQILAALDRIGQRHDSYHAAGASAQLYVIGQGG